MKQPKVFAHASYIGTTGYNNHTREFFRHLSKYLDIKVRNYTVGSKWDESFLEEPHNNEPYLIDIDKNILDQQTLLQGGNEQNRFETKIYPNYGQDFNHNVNLILKRS